MRQETKSINSLYNSITSQLRCSANIESDIRQLSIISHVSSLKSHVSCLKHVSRLMSIISCLILLACSPSEKSYTPKPKGFNRINLPAAAYQSLGDAHPYTFEYSKNAIIQKDTFAMAEKDWIIVYYPKLDARIQLTYKPLNGDLNKLQNLIYDAYKLADKHQVKASSQEEKLVQFKSGKKAVVIEIDGEVPSHFQFYVTDTSRNYLRGAVYLMHATENDSLRPVVDYMKGECLHLLETLKWKK